MVYLIEGDHGVHSAAHAQQALAAVGEDSTQASARAQPDVTEAEVQLGQIAWVLFRNKSAVHRTRVGLMIRVTLRSSSRTCWRVGLEYQSSRSTAGNTRSALVPLVRGLMALL